MKKIHLRKRQHCDKMMTLKVFRGNGETERLCKFLVRKFCSNKCKIDSGICRLGKHHTSSSKHLMSIKAFGKHENKKNGQWKGNKASYAAKHMWIYKKFGTPMKCEICKVVYDNKRKIHWSNINHLYRRIRQDWQRLCAKCHKAYDRKLNYV